MARLGRIAVPGVPHKRLRTVELLKKSLDFAIKIIVDCPYLSHSTFIYVPETLGQTKIIRPLMVNINSTGKATSYVKTVGTRYMQAMPHPSADCRG